MTLPLRLAADAVAPLHLAFVPFAAFGGQPVWRWPRRAGFHRPAAGAPADLAGRTCPLAPPENLVRRAVGEAGRDGGHIDLHLWPPPDPVGSIREGRERSTRAAL